MSKLGFGVREGVKKSLEATEPRRKSGAGIPAYFYTLSILLLYNPKTLNNHNLPLKTELGLNLGSGELWGSSLQFQAFWPILLS